MPCGAMAHTYKLNYTPSISGLRLQYLADKYIQIAVPDLSSKFDVRLNLLLYANRP
jgi:hypothetical protein